MFADSAMFPLSYTNMLLAKAQAEGSSPNLPRAQMGQTLGFTQYQEPMLSYRKNGSAGVCGAEGVAGD